MIVVRVASSHHSFDLVAKGRIKSCATSVIPRLSLCIREYRIGQCKFVIEGILSSDEPFMLML